MDAPTPPAALAAGQWRWRCIDVDGTVLWDERLKNAITTAGLNYMLNTAFRGTSQSSTWYGGVIDNAGYTALAAGDTMASHSGWAESVAYTESVRQTWGPNAASGGVITGTTAMSFTASGSVTVRGFFLTDSNTKSGTSGTLFCTAVDAAGRAFTTGQTIQAYYTVTLTPT